MSFSRLHENKKTLLVSGIILSLFLILLFVYQEQLSSHEPLVKKNEPSASTTDTTTVVTPGASSTPVVSSEKPPASNTKMNVGKSIGIAAGSKLVGMSDKALDDEMRGMKEMGMEWVRFDIEWGFVQYGNDKEKNSKTYDWSRYDRIINAAAKYNLKSLPILTYTPEWARVPGCRGGAHCPPADPHTFAAFAAAAATRYKDKGVHYWEIWNEPNSFDFWATKADCKAYTALLKATYPALRKADPKAFVLTGGLAQVATNDVSISDLDFFSCIYNEGGKNYFDAVSNHPYTFPNFPSATINNAWGRMSTSVISFRSIMKANGDGNKKIWITEYGAPTGGPDSNWYISEEKQAQMVEDALSLYKTYDWVGPFFWYTYIDSGKEPTSNENFFGFIRFDGTPKPAYYKLKEMIKQGL